MTKSERKLVQPDSVCLDLGMGNCLTRRSTSDPDSNSRS